MQPAWNLQSLNLPEPFHNPGILKLNVMLVTSLACNGHENNIILPRRAYLGFTAEVLSFSSLTDYAEFTFLKMSEIKIVTLLKVH